MGPEAPDEKKFPVVQRYVKKIFGYEVILGAMEQKLPKYD